VSVKK